VLNSQRELCYLIYVNILDKAVVYISLNARPGTAHGTMLQTKQNRAPVLSCARLHQLFLVC